MPVYKLHEPTWIDKDRWIGLNIDSCHETTYLGRRRCLLAVAEERHQMGEKLKAAPTDSLHCCNKKLRNSISYCREMEKSSTSSLC